MHVSQTVKPGRHDGVRAMDLTHELSADIKPQQLLTRQDNWQIDIGLRQDPIVSSLLGLLHATPN
jgi:hypothetical protein